MPTKLDQPKKAYLVMEPDGITTLEVVGHYDEAANIYFKIVKSFWIAPQGFLPAPGNTIPLRIDPSARGNPFEHQNVAWTQEDAVALYREKRLKQAAYCREHAAELLKDAKAIEQTDYQKLILGQESYISPFTGKTI